MTIIEISNQIGIRPPYPKRNRTTEFGSKNQLRDEAGFFSRAKREVLIFGFIPSPAAFDQYQPWLDGKKVQMIVGKNVPYTSIHHSLARGVEVFQTEEDTSDLSGFAITDRNSLLVIIPETEKDSKFQIVINNNPGIVVEPARKFELTRNKSLRIEIRLLTADEQCT